MSNQPRKPLAVVRQAQAADEAIANLRAQVSGTPPAEPMPSDDNAAEDALLVGAQPPQNAAPAPVAQQQEPTPPAAAPEAAPVDDLAAQFATLQQAHRTLQGKYNSETQRAREDRERLQRDMDSLRALIATLQAAPKAAPAPAAPPPARVTPKEVEEFGEDLLDAAGRFAAQQWQPVVDQLRAELAELRGEVATTKSTATAARQHATMSAREQMHAVLDTKLPNWRDINVDDGFKEWLQQEDEASGERRHTLLLKAYNENATQRVLHFFNRYLAEHAQPKNPAPAAPAADTAPAAGQPKVDPTAFVAPARGRSAPRSNDAQPKIMWTAADIAAFYADVQAGRYRKLPEDRARLEADIFAAQRDGRIQRAS